MIRPCAVAAAAKRQPLGMPLMPRFNTQERRYKLYHGRNGEFRGRERERERGRRGYIYIYIRESDDFPGRCGDFSKRPTPTDPLALQASIK